MRRISIGFLTVLAAALLLSGCSLQPALREPAVDGGGLTESEARAMSFEQQYLLAGERHQELNERLAQLQAEIFEDEWLDGSTVSEVIPWDGYVMSPGLPGITRDNTYNFSVSRWYFPEQDIATLVREVGKSWEARGWQITEETIPPGGGIRVFFTTDDGYWFECIQRGEDEIKLTGESPVYWGDSHRLIQTAAERRDAENAAGATWDTTERDERGHAYRLPGVFRPFPAWDAVSEGAGSDASS